MPFKFKEIRMLKGYSQQEVADYLHCTAVTYSRYENGNRNPSLDLLIKIADLFDVSVDCLLNRENISPQALTNYELSLIEASRNADERAREDAIIILQSHSMNKVNNA